jgi:hypothetical protein
MNESEETRAEAAVQQRFRRPLLWWWRKAAPEERYLAAATDHADLERRQRALERMTTGPAFMTFNH